MPEYTIKVDHPDYPKGEMFQVANLPVELVNGRTVEVDADAAQAFKDATGNTVLQGLKDSYGFEVSTSDSKKDGDS